MVSQKCSFSFRFVQDLELQVLSSFRNCLYLEEMKTFDFRMEHKELLKLYIMGLAILNIVSFFSVWKKEINICWDKPSKSLKYLVSQKLSFHYLLCKLYSLSHVCKLSIDIESFWKLIPSQENNKLYSSWIPYLFIICLICVFIIHIKRQNLLLIY